MIVDNIRDCEKSISENDIFNDITFDIENEDLKILKFKSIWVQFKNCTFNCKTLSINFINQNDLVLEFANCTFNCDVSFNNCKINSLKFSNTKSIKSLRINGNFSDFEKKSEINSFQFKNTKENNELENNDKIILSTHFNFHNVLFKKYFEFNNINNINGIFGFSNNRIGDKEFDKVSSCVFHSSKLTNVNFSDNEFKTYTSFKNSTFSFNYDNFKDSGSRWKESKFERNEFNKVNFSEIEVVGYLEFDNCEFHRTTLFEKCKNLEKSEITFRACKFEKYSLFDNSKFNKFEILHSKFLEKASFENLEINYFKIHQVTFAEAAYFDDLNKSNEKAIENWDRKTLRAIKREVVNTHNQIDYLRFKAYELNAYDKEKEKNCKDQIVLFFNRHSNYFGLDWTKGLWFIFITSFSFYLLYLITFIIGIKDTCFMPQTCEEFLVIYIKFLNPVSFLKTPIEEAEVYFFPLLFLNLSKIFVSYGIYQTIQAFRKFGVNGG